MIGMAEGTTGAEAATGAGRRATRWAGYGACAWAVLFAAPHVWWLFGVSAGFPGGGAALDDALGSSWFVAYDLLVVLLSAVGAIVALATVRPWERLGPPRVRLGLAWGAAGALLARGIAGLVVDGLADAVWWPTFVVGGVLFGLTARAYRSGPGERQVAA